jgi:alpha-beta hydrolase superfamily lysophospholipase
VDSNTYRTRDGLELITRHWPAAGTATATMLIVHGMAEHCGRWDHVGEFFAAAGFDVHGFDLRGHGVSDGPRLDVAGFDDYVDDLAEIVAEVRDDDLPLVLYGHSMGGLVTVLYAESDHSQADYYVLSAPAIGADVAPPLRIAAAVLGRAAPGIRMNTGLKGEQLARDAAVGEAYFADPLVSVKATTRFGQALFNAMTRASANLGAIGTPTLVIHGGDDTIVPVGVSAPLAAVPEVERRVWPGLRHEIHNEPEQREVLAFVAAWLDDHIRERG